LELSFLLFFFFFFFLLLANKRVAKHDGGDGDGDGARINQLFVTNNTRSCLRASNGREVIPISPEQRHGIIVTTTNPISRRRRRRARPCMMIDSLRSYLYFAHVLMVIVRVYVWRHDCADAIIRLSVFRGDGGVVRKSLPSAKI
jgi:hypothetical protein